MFDPQHPMLRIHNDRLSCLSFLNISYHLGNYMKQSFASICKSLLLRIHRKIKRSRRPTTLTLAIGVLSDLSRSHTDLIAENAMLRQQLIVLHHQIKRPNLRIANGSVWSCLPAALNSGDRPSTSSSPIPSFSGTDTYFDYSGDINRGLTKETANFPRKHWHSSPNDPRKSIMGYRENSCRTP